MPDATAEPLYAAAIQEAYDQCVRLGLDVGQADEYDAASLIRKTYGAGWLACESRLDCRDMADLIHRAINQPGEITEKLVAESDNQHQVRAVQQVVTYGVKSEPH